MAYEDVLARFPKEEVVSSRHCYICWEGIAVAKLTEETDLNGHHSYIIEPDWTVYDKCRELGMPFISGINEEAHLKEYVRTRYVPCFIRQRTWDPHRPDMGELLTSVGLEKYDRFEVLVRMHGRCMDDTHYVELHKPNQAD